MNDAVYAQRREVMNYLYEVKNLLRQNNITMPRVTIRITEKASCLARASMSKKEVWVTEQSLTKEYKSRLRHIVYHELVHTLSGFGHDKNCPLMQPIVATKAISKEKLQSLLLKYF